MIIKNFKRIFSEGWNFLAFSAIFALVARVMFYVAGTHSSNTQEIFGYRLENLGEFYSMLIAGAIVAVMAILVHRINLENVYIRTKTTLPASILLLFFSINPDFYTLRIGLIAALCMLLVIRILFAAYNLGKAQVAALNASLVIALGATLEVSMLIYLPVLWWSLTLMRNFNFKALLASIFAIFVLYTPIISYYFVTDPEKLSSFLDTLYTKLIQHELAIYSFDTYMWIAMGGATTVFIIVFFFNFANSFKDKIRVRAYNTLLTVYIILTMLLICITDTSIDIFQCIALAISPLLLAHFFALAEKKWQAIMFILLIIYLIVLFFYNSPFFI